MDQSDGTPAQDIHTLLDCQHKNCRQNLTNDGHMKEHFRLRHFEAIRRQLISMGPLSHLKTINKTTVATNAFICRQIGCHKVFFNKDSYGFHKRHHRIKRHPIDRSLHSRRNGNPLKTKSGQSSTTTNGNQWSDKQTDKEVTVKTSKGHKLSKTSKRVDKKATKPLVNGNGFQDFEKVKDNVVMDVFNDMKRCVCKRCGHETFGVRAKSKIAIHMNCKHLRNNVFKCDMRSDGKLCNKTYLSPSSLRVHKMNHLCGFGIKRGRYMTTVCGNKNLNTFRTPIVIQDMKFFRCSFTDNCQFLATSSNAIKRHIHSHVCPFRVKPLNGAQKLGPNTIDIIKEFDKFGTIIESNGRQLFQCKSCPFISSTIQGLIAHIKHKHYLINDKTFSMTSDAIKAIHSKVVIDLDMNCSTNTDYELGDTTDGRQERDNENEAKNSVDYKNGMDCDDNEDMDLDEAEEWLHKNKKHQKWMPFPCSYCRRRFDDLLTLRNHHKSDH